jgi:antitoxin FitA
VANVNVKNLPDDDVLRAIQIEAEQHGRTEAEIRAILERAVKSERVKLGTYLVSIARETGGLSDEEHALIEGVRVNPASALPHA